MKNQGGDSWPNLTAARIQMFSESKFSLYDNVKDQIIKINIYDHWYTYIQH
jgi:hypothetical protein